MPLCTTREVLLHSLVNAVLVAVGIPATGSWTTFKVQGLGFGVSRFWGSGFIIWGTGFRV